MGNKRLPESYQYLNDREFREEILLRLDEIIGLLRFAMRDIVDAGEVEKIEKFEPMTVEEFMDQTEEQHDQGSSVVPMERSQG